MEYACGGELFDYMATHTRGISEVLARHFFRQIVSAIDYCHQVSIFLLDSLFISINFLILKILNL
jgi:serine/threonine protein kinase